MAEDTEPKIYSGNGWKIIASRWQDHPPKRVDCCISDPPYDERTHRTARVSGSGRAPGGGCVEIINVPPLSFGAIDPADVGPALVALAARWVVLFCSVEQLGGYRDACGKTYIRGGAWIKNNPKPQFSGDRPGQGFDGIAIMHRSGRKRWNRGGHCAVWRATAPIGRGSEVRYHETVKPVDLMLALVSDFSDPGELVWDPYGGSGTTGVACLRLGRRYLMHEMQPHYAKIAAERLEAETRGLTLQDARRGQQSILDVLGDE